MEFTLIRKINASARDIYTLWLSSEGHSKITGGAALSSDQVGDHFTAWDGYIEGSNLILEPYKRIVQSWRTSEFKEDEPNSQIEILLSEDDGKTEFTLIHSNIPDSGEHYKKGWDEHYFEPMQTYFQGHQ